MCGRFAPDRSLRQFLQESAVNPAFVGAAIGCDLLIVSVGVYIRLRGCQKFCVRA